MEAIEVERLAKTYPGGIAALDGISFAVHRGEIFGLLGPNGAGKSTTIQILAGLTRPTGGRAVVEGMEVGQHSRRIRAALGYVPQDVAVDDCLTGWETLYFWARLYGLSRAQATERVAGLLDTVDLAARADDLVATYSGGMRKRLDIAAGLVHRPPVLMLDEPTLGLDVHTRNEIWKYLDRLRADAGVAILLSTHYLEEGERYCDRVAIIDHGRIVAQGRSQDLAVSAGQAGSSLEAVYLTLTAAGR